jgi:hypothetical protein
MLCVLCVHALVYIHYLHDEVYTDVYS